MGYSSLDAKELQKGKVEKRGEARDMFRGLSDLMGTTSSLTKASKIYTSVGRMVTDVTMEISRNDRTPLGNKTRRELGLLMQMLAQMEKNLENLVTSHRAIIEEMDKGYKAVEGLKMDMKR